MRYDSVHGRSKCAISVYCSSDAKPNADPNGTADTIPDAEPDTGVWPSQLCNDGLAARW